VTTGFLPVMTGPERAF